MRNHRRNMLIFCSLLYTASLSVGVDTLPAQDSPPDAEKQDEAEPTEGKQPPSADKPSSTENVSRLEFRAGPMWIGNAFRYVENESGEEEKVYGSAVSPIITAPGLAVHIPMKRWTSMEKWSLIAGLDIVYQEYVELPDGSPAPGKAVPTDTHIGSDSPYIDTDESQNVAGVLILPLQAALEYPLVRRSIFTSGPSAGLTVLSRIPFPIVGDSVAGILSYQWGSGRFLYPETGWWITFHTHQNFDYGLRLRALWPAANLWALEEEAGWWDGLHIQLQAVIQIDQEIGLLK